jgi:hypothetical protein
MSDMVKKSREIENYDKKRPIIYREMVSQGDVFVEEVFIEDFREVPLEQLEWDPTKDGIADFSFKKRLQKVYSGCASRMVNGKKIYLGNIRCEYAEDQDLIAVLNIYSRDRAESIYGKWERWKYVPKTIETTEAFENDGTTYKDWNLVTIGDSGDRVAEIRIYEPRKNRFMIMLNGVMMLPINYPLTSLCPTDNPIAQGKYEPISDFAYSKSQPSKTKVDQEVIDEFTKLAVEKTRQSFKPPMGNTTKKVFSQSIFLPGKITPNVSPNQLFPLLGDRSYGINAAEFSFYELIKRSIDEKSVNPNFSGDVVEKEQTLGEVMEMKQQSMMKLALAIDGIMNLERRMTWNRIYNILQNWTKPVDQSIDTVRGGVKDVYRNFSVQTTVDNGEKGIKMFRLTKDDYPSVADQAEEGDLLSKQYRMPVRIVYMDPELLATLKYNWFILINPTPKSNDKLSQLLFVQNVVKAMEIFGPESLNLDYIKQRFAILINEDYNKFFKKMDIMQMLQMGMQSPEVQNARGAMGGRKVNKSDAVGRQEMRAAVG